jgi:hypothetical protein
MQSFVQRFAGLILGVLSGWDRLRFRGTERWLANPKGLFGFLWSRRVLLEDFGAAGGLPGRHGQAHRGHVESSRNKQILLVIRDRRGAS